VNSESGVLVVTDDPKWGDGEARPETTDEFDLTWARTADEALERLDGSIDCVVSAYALGGRDGVQFLEAVRETHPELPFVLCAADGSEDVAARAIAADVTEYLPFGINPDTWPSVTERVATAVDSVPAANREPRPTAPDSAAGPSSDRSLRELAEEYDALLDNSGDAIFLVDVDRDDGFEFRFAQLSPGYETQTGLTTAAVRGKTPREVFGAERGAELAANYAQCVEAGAPISYREKLEMDEDARFWETSLAPVVVDGEIVRVLGIARNVTEQIERERALQETNERLESLFDATPLTVMEIDPEGNVLRWNDAAEEMFGWTREEVIGEPNPMIPPDRDHEFDSHRRRALDGERIRTKEVQRRTKDGEQLDLLLSVAPVHGPDGDVVSVIAVLDDVTERVEQRQELQRERDRLDEFASLASHDLRNPLNVAKGRTELARAERESEHLDAVASALDRMDQLITDLLTLARQGKTVGDREPIRIDALAARCWKNVETNDATIEVQSEATLRGDQSRTTTLLENLFRNAIEHGSQTGGATGDAERQQSGPTVVVGELDDHDGFYVEDDGPGMTAAERERAFESGYTTNEDGTGFGLAIVKQIVEAHGWTITATESASGGARFEIAGVTLGEE
jgi:PAS domain S-box-containing protein